MRWPPWVELLRPYQWYKNLIVFVPLIFSRNVFHGAVWVPALITFAGFCLMASGSYAWNDVIDKDRDRAHPFKRRRPVASGRVSASAALLLGTAFALAGLWLLFLTNAPTVLLGITYLIVQALYSLLLKHHVIWDVLTIASGFVLRALAGTTAIDVGNPTVWLILCTFLFALYLALGKRRHELLLFGNPRTKNTKPKTYRPILHEYSPELLERMTNIVASLLLASYFIYTAFGSTPWLMLTIPFALYGVLRYMYLAHRQDLGDEPEFLWHDSPTLLNALTWFTVVLLVLEGTPERLFLWLQAL